MCNFMVQEYNRGAVIFGLPDFSGKARPMCLLTDVKPNDLINYGMTLNAFQICTQCYNKFSVPIQIRWSNSSKRICYIDTLYTMRFSQQELFAHEISFCGILSSELLDLCYRTLTTYLSGNYKELSKIADEIKEVRLEFLAKNTLQKHMDYRNVQGGITRLYVDGREEEIVQPRTSFVGGTNNSQEILGKSGFEPISKEDSKRDVLTQTIKIPEDVIAQIRDTSEEDSTSEDFDQMDTTDATIPAADILQEVVSEQPVRTKAPSILKSLKKHKKAKVLWVSGKQIPHQSTKALEEFLAMCEVHPKKEIGALYGIALNTVYTRRLAVAKELGTRYETNPSKVDADIEKIVIKWGGGRQSHPE